MTTEDPDNIKGKSTLFVRKLPFEATTQLEEFFSEYGPIRSCFVVNDKKDENVEEGATPVKKSNRGFGFVQFVMPEDAQNALKQGCKRKFQDRTLKLDMAVKKQYRDKVDSVKGKKAENPKKLVKDRIIIRDLPETTKEVLLKKELAKFGKITYFRFPPCPEGKKRYCFIEFKQKTMTEKAMKTLTSKGCFGAKVSIEWSLPMGVYKQEKIRKLQEQKEQYVKDTVETDGKQIEDKAEGSVISENDDFDDDENEDSGQQEESASEEVHPESKNKSHKVPPKEKQSDVGDGRTMFIRNLSFDTQEEDLKEFFEQFGPIQYCRITQDRVTGMSKGTGFVRFYNKIDADQCLTEAKQIQGQNTALEEKSKKTSFLKGKKSVLTPELESDLTSKFTLDGRVLNIDVAVERKQAEKLTATRLQEREEKQDKRNTYLLYEGLIKPDSEAAKSLTEKELSVRQSSFQERKKSLQANPNLFVSTTRLSIRNLPLQVDEKKLKKVGLDSVKLFRAQFKAGKKQDKLQEFEGLKGVIQVVQVKIIRSNDRPDPKTGLGRSKGYGFIEFSKHAHALAFLRQVNNNPRAFGDKKRPIVEFALENVLALRKQKDRREKAAGKKKKEEAIRKEGE